MTNCPKCGSIQGRINPAGHFYTCGSKVIHGGGNTLIEGFDCLRNQLAQRDERIRELEEVVQGIAQKEKATIRRLTDRIFPRESS
jgi:hypothetical protein